LTESLTTIMQAIEVHLRAGAFEEAGDMVQYALTFPDAFGQIKPLMNHVTRLKRNDLCEAVLALLLTSPEISLRDKINHGVDFAHLCNAAVMRHVSIRCLRRCLEMSGDDVGLLERVAAALEMLGENSMALEACNRLALYEPDNVLRKVSVAALQAITDKPAGRELVAALLKSPLPDPKFWSGLSSAQQRLGDGPGAIKAAEMAMAYGADEVMIRRRLVALHTLSRNARAAILQVKAIMAKPGLSSGVLRQVSAMALELGERPLGLAAAKRQFEEYPQDLEAAAFYAATLTQLGKTQEGTERLAAICDSLPLRPPLHRHEYLMLAGTAEKMAQDDFRLRVLKLGLTSFAGDRWFEDQIKLVEGRLKLLQGGLFAKLG